METPADGTTTNFEFDFDGGYIDQDHIKVTLIDADGVETDATYTWAGPYTVNITSAPALGTTVRIRRMTPNDGALMDFENGAIVTEGNLDTLYKQSIFAAADAADTGILAADEVRRQLLGFKLWTPGQFANWLKDAIAAALGTAYKGDKGDKGDPGTPGTPGATGPQGIPGIKGDTGTNAATPNITVAASTLAPGSTATATVSGSYPNLLLSLGLPKGDTGSVEITGDGAAQWGLIQGTLTDQADLASALGSKLDASALTGYATQVYVNNAVSTKADTSALSNYALLSDLSTGLAGKADNDDLIPYALASDVAASIGSVSDEVDGKAPLVHTHGIADVSGLQAAIDAKADPGDFAAIDHTHAQADVSGLTTALNAKQKQITSGTTAPSGGSSGDVYFKVA